MSVENIKTDPEEIIEGLGKDEDASLGASFQSREAGAWRPEDSFGYNEGDVVNFPGTDTRFSF